MGCNSEHKQVFMIDGKTDRQVVNPAFLAFIFYLDWISTQKFHLQLWSDCCFSKRRASVRNPFLVWKMLIEKEIAVEKKI